MRSVPPRPASSARRLPPLALVCCALVSGCDPTPYDAFVACRAVIETVAKLEETGSCFLRADAEFLRNDEERASYLSDLREPALERLTLVRSDPLEPTAGAEIGERVALRFDVSEQPATDVVTGYSAIMRAVDGEWRYEGPLTFIHGDYDNAGQAGVTGSLDFTGALDRRGDRIVAAVHTAGQRRALTVIDRFDGARVTFLSPRPFALGRYDLGEEIQAEARLDDDRYFTGDVTGYLEILEAGPNGLSGTFTFGADSNHSGPLEASGRFARVPEVAIP